MVNTPLLGHASYMCENFREQDSHPNEMGTRPHKYNKNKTLLIYFTLLPGWEYIKYCHITHTMGRGGTSALRKLGTNFKKEVSWFKATEEK